MAFVCCKAPLKLKATLYIKIIKCKESLNKLLQTRKSCAIILKSKMTRGRSSAGRALEWHSRGHRFDPDRLHQKSTENGMFLVLFSFLSDFQVPYLIKSTQKSTQTGQNNTIADNNKGCYQWLQ